MKKILCVFLAVMLVLGLCACGGEGGSEQGGSNTSAGLQVGFGREKIMPTEPVNISGGGDASRISEGYLDILYTTCIAITDEAGETVLIYTQDLQQVSESFAGPAKKEISQATGVPQEKIMIAATHTHSVPSQSLSKLGIEAYFPIYKEGMVKAAQAAMADRSAATVSVGSTKADGYVFVRHYKISNGTYAGPSYGNFGAGTNEGHAYDADTELQLIKFTRAAEDKKDIVLMNLGAHATFFSATTYKQLSADFPGPTRDYIEANSDCLVAYFMAAAGDQTPDTKMAELEHGLDYKGYGEAIGKLVVDALPNMTPVEGGNINLLQKTYNIPTNTRGQDKLEQAKEVYNLYTSGSGKVAADALAAQYGFISVYEARAIVNNHNRGASTDISLHALSIGDISFIFAPYEMFSANGRQIKDGSPYKDTTTFVITQANATVDYIPAEMGYVMDCYEAYTSLANKGTGEDLAKTFIDMLTQLKNGQ